MDKSLIEFIKKIQIVLGFYDHKTFKSGNTVLDKINSLILEETKRLEKDNQKQI